MSVRQLEQPPGLGRLYARAAITARGRHGDRLPDVVYELPELTVDRNNLSGYAQVCGFRQSDVLPPTYPHLLGFPAAVSIMVDSAFPFPLPGLVHVNNRIEQQRGLHADERLRVRVHAEGLRDHRRGRQFDMITEVSAGGEPVWTEVSTYLRREKKPSSHSLSPPDGRGQGEGPSPSASPASGEGRGGGHEANALWRIPRDIGRRYAAVSGDVNPIHLNPLAARLFGFPRSIAHGMWLKARCLAALEGRIDERVIAEVAFKSPLLLPSTVAFNAGMEEDSWRLAVSQVHGDRQHLVGSVTNRA